MARNIFVLICIASAAMLSDDARGSVFTKTMMFRTDGSDFDDMLKTFRVSCFPSRGFMFSLFSAPAEPLGITPCCTLPRDKGDTFQANSQKAHSHLRFHVFPHRVSCVPSVCMARSVPFHHTFCGGTYLNTHL